MKKRKRKHNDGGVVLGLALVLLVVYLGGYLFDLAARERVPETVVVMGSIEPILTFPGVIVRDETVYHSNARGIVVHHAQNLSRIRAGGVAASVQDEAAVRRYLDSIGGIEASFYRDQGGRNFSSAVEAELRNIDNQLARSVDTLAPMMGGALCTQSLQNLAQRTDQLINRRNQVLFNEGGGDVPHLWGVYRTSLEGAISQISIASSGILSYIIDGYEETFAPARIRVLSREETLTYVDFGELHIPTMVYPGDPVFKIVNSHIWYIVAYLPIDQVEGFHVGANRTIYVDDGSGNFSPLQTNVQVIERGGAEAYVALRVNRQVCEFLDRRSINFMIRQDLPQGLKIPNSAIADKTLYFIPAECVIVRDTGIRYVLRHNAEIGGFQDLAITPFPRIQPANAEFITIIAEYNGIHQGDVLAIRDRIGESRTVTQSEPIRGVYVTNTGAANFHRINMGGNARQNAHYTILDPAFNSAIRPHDRIVSDASLVDNRQVIH